MALTPEGFASLPSGTAGVAVASGDAGPGPLAFTARTSKPYSVPLASPPTM